MRVRVAKSARRIAARACVARMRARIMCSIAVEVPSGFSSLAAVLSTTGGRNSPPTGSAGSTRARFDAGDALLDDAGVVSLLRAVLVISLSPALVEITPLLRLVAVELLVVIVVGTAARRCSSDDDSEISATTLSGTAAATAVTDASAGVALTDELEAPVSAVAGVTASLIETDDVADGSTSRSGGGPLVTGA